MVVAGELVILMLLVLPLMPLLGLIVLEGVGREMLDDEDRSSKHLIPSRQRPSSVHRALSCMRLSAAMAARCLSFISSSSLPSVAFSDLWDEDTGLSLETPDRKVISSTTRSSRNSLSGGNKKLISGDPVRSLSSESTRASVRWTWTLSS